MGATAWAAHGFVFRALSGGHSVYGSNALATMVGIGCGVVVYGVLIIALRILRAEDVRSIRGGDKLIRLLHLK